MFDFDRFQSRLIEARDASQFFQLIETNRKRLETFLPITAGENAEPKLTPGYIARKNQEANDRTTFTMILEDAETESFAGFMVIKNIDWNEKECELGYFIDRNWEGQGVMTQYVKATCEHCKNELGLSRIAIVTSPSNTGSVSVAHKNGFEFERTLEDLHHDADGNEIVVNRYVYNGHRE